MITEPGIIERAEQPYVAIRATKPMGEMDMAAARLFPEVGAWLAARGIAPAGAPILKHNVIDMERELELEFGLPTADDVVGDGRIVSGRLPAGRYASVFCFGPYGGPDDELYRANATLIGWGEQRQIRWDSRMTPAGERFGCRLEIYHAGPQSEPDSARWETEVAIRIADA